MYFREWEKTPFSLLSFYWRCVVIKFFSAHTMKIGCTERTMVFSRLLRQTNHTIRICIFISFIFNKANLVYSEGRHLALSVECRICRKRSGERENGKIRERKRSVSRALWLSGNFIRLSVANNVERKMLFVHLFGDPTEQCMSQIGAYYGNKAMIQLNWTREKRSS